MKILYLEDDLMQQLTVSSIAEGLGHSVVCESTLEAFKLRLQSESFDLILMDNLLEDDVNSFKEIDYVREVVGPSVGIVGLTGADSFKKLTKKYKDISLLNHLICKPISADNIESAFFFVGGGAR